MISFFDVVNITLKIVHIHKIEDQIVYFCRLENNINDRESN